MLKLTLQNTSCRGYNRSRQPKLSTRCHALGLRHASTEAKSETCTYSLCKPDLFWEFPEQIAGYGPCWMFPALLIGLSSLGTILILNVREKKPAIKEQPDYLNNMLNMNTKCPNYQKALASTRQAANIHKAVAFQKTGDTARALVELSKALQENNLCRCPLLDGQQTHEELRDLYKLHIANGEVPPNFATLLQLQVLFDLSREEAERLESEVMQSSVAFSI